MTDDGIVVGGIPIPSTSPTFLAFVAIHVAAGIVCPLAGIVAMLAPKKPGRHPRGGTTYFWSLMVVCVTTAVLAAMRWPSDNHLLALGILSAASAVIGRTARRHLWRHWAHWHLLGMSISYILMLTAFYVDNGPHLPFFRHFPALAFWFMPTLVGLPIVLFVLRRHPLLQRPRRTPLFF
jgi:hypothetical protein